MGGFGSGGHNKLTLAERVARGTLRPTVALATMPAPEAPVTASDRAITLAGLGPTGAALVARLLDEFSGWDPAALHTLKLYGQSCDVLAGEIDADDRRAELRVNLGLLRALQLERGR